MSLEDDLYDLGALSVDLHDLFDPDIDGTEKCGHERSADLIRGGLVEIPDVLKQVDVGVQDLSASLDALFSASQPLLNGASLERDDL